MELARRSRRLGWKCRADRSGRTEINSDVQNHNEHAHQQPAGLVSPPRAACRNAAFRDTGDGYSREQGISLGISVEFENVSAGSDPRDRAATLGALSDKNRRSTICHDKNKTRRSIARIPSNISAAG